MNREFCLRNAQRAQPVAGRLLRRLALTLLSELLNVSSFSLAVHLVGPRRMTRLNETFLRHQGVTDVITFNYGSGEPVGARGNPAMLHGDIFICVADATAQARRFRTTWQSELVRCLVHGVLHLLGHDDLRPGPRRKMRRAEDRLLRELSRRFPLSKLDRKPKVAP